MTQTTALTPDQVRRYSRHIIMPQVGSRGQRSLLEAKVLIVGAGGLGSPVALYLAWRAWAPWASWTSTWWR